MACRENVPVGVVSNSPKSSTRRTKFGLRPTPLYSGNTRRHSQRPSMLQRSSGEEAVITAPTALPAWRPVLFFLCIGLTMAGLIWLATGALSPGGLGALDNVFVALFSLAPPR